MRGQREANKENKLHRKYRHYLSYQTKLTMIFTAMTVSVIFVFAAVMFKRQEENLTDTMYRTIQVENQKNAIALGNVFESIRDLAAALALNDNICDSIEELPDVVGRNDIEALTIQRNLFKTMLISKLATMSQMINMRIYSKNGMCACVTKQRSGIEDRYYWETDWFELFVVNNRDWMLTFSREGDIPVLTVSRTVRKAATAVLVGYLEVNYDFSGEVKDILEATSLEGDYRYYLLDKENLVITNDGQPFPYQLEKAEDGVKTLMEGFYQKGQMTDSQVFKADVEGKDFLLAAFPVENTDYILVSGTEACVLRAQTRQEYIMLLAVLIPGTVIAVGISFYTARGLSRNIQRLNNAMKEAERNPDIQVEIASADEIGMLSKSFNRMIIELQGTYRDLYTTEMNLREANNLALQAQINPHFLYNTLETIDALSVCERTEDIGRVVQSMSKVFRYAMEEKRSVPLREEAGHVRQYLQILEIRYENRFVWSVELEDGIAELEVPKIILQPLVENAIIHGILKREGPGRLEVRIEEQDGFARLSVTDNGAGMDRDTLEALRRKLETDKEEKGNHIGVHNVDKRMKYFFGGRYHLEMSSQAGCGTRMVICFRMPEE